VHALALDPRTAAVCALNDIRAMAMEMVEAQRAWLPEFEGRAIRPTPTIGIPPDVVPVDVPLDPALAIHERLGKLVSQKTT
jgi:alpha-galactosidase